MRFCIVTAAILLAGFGLSAQTIAPTPQSGPEAVALQPFLDSHVLTGAVTLVAGKADILDLEAIGSRDAELRQPMTTNDEFWIASMTKAMTAAAIMVLVDEHKISLDDPVEKYLPKFHSQRALVNGKQEPVSHAITIREILSSTSCLPFSSSWEGAHHRLDLRPLAVSVVDYASEPLRCQPGTEFLYSNEGFNTAGRIVELVGGLPFETFLQQRLFEPLGMKDTTFWPSPSQLLRLAQTYSVDQASQSNRPAENDQLSVPFSDRSKRFPMPAGGLFSTATDVAHFCQMLLGRGMYQGQQILSDAAVTAMTTNQVPEGVANPSKFGLPYGLGLYLRPDGFGHSGAYKTEMYVDQKHELVTVFLVQQFGPWLKKDGDRMLTLVRNTGIRLKSSAVKQNSATVP